jgi:hypothetical protein
MGFFHHIGTFLLLAATILLIVTCISAPVVHDIGLLKIQLGTGRARDYTHVSFGTFGACVNYVDAPYVTTLASSAIGLALTISQR